MAGTATATYSADVWSSASTIDGGQQQWEYSVPVNNENNRRRSKSRTRTSRDAKSRDRGSKGSRSSSLSKHAYAHEQSHYASRGRRDASTSRRESESGGVQDVLSRPHSNGPTRKSVSKDGDDEQNGENEEKWIHRDKLARIESEELQQAAILFHRRPGTGSTRAGRGRSRDQHIVNGSTVATSPPTEQTEPWPDLQEDQRNNGVSSNLADDDDVPDEERKFWDLRRPEEIAADRESGASSIYRNPALRKSSSRIPIPMSSPAPLSSDQIDRDYFTPRSRAPTDEEENRPSIAMPRRASEPLTLDSASTSSPAPESRPGSRGVQAPQNATSKKSSGKPGATKRNTSAPHQKKSTPRSRATSSNNAQRPTTRSGEPRPPTAVNRPEGDPPWLATMYKPDPRLPPDQQILPTHARKLQQEQWAKEGKTPTTYDREFAPLAIAPDAARPQDKPKETEKPDQLKTEGLGLHAMSRSPEPGTRPGTSTGYSPMPKLQDTPPTQLTPRFNSQTVTTAQGPPPEDEKVEKGCGCCIVM
ncbi:hypothetical protein ASPVEDRAFT_55357 [Aspergillus versicolor CBS 583.65]|uniref:TeaA receptor TeaR n=1 Tax=Aspergillus versicolor CBS 583.65 TaxID=1036611 RepID=A0A1L9PV80_ASPVE|nr:uncharacterized protein ASPVEDRAFT_55357 [Aspergillus versicolor CBS 583.65]OJJ05464.1 hypothetical protein ASPVEDRAFT_55357 [Aspergillus versicolor CBS 583.65]